MNKNLLLVILAVSLIPAFMSFGRGLTGMVVDDTSAIAQSVTISAPVAPVAQTGHPFLSGLVLIYVIITIVVLAVAASYLISIYSKKPANITPHKHLSNSLQNIKHAFRSHHSDAKVVKTLKFAKISDERASQLIVGIVAVVGFIAILIIIF